MYSTAMYTLHYIQIYCTSFIYTLYYLTHYTLILYSDTILSLIYYHTPIYYTYHGGIAPVRYHALGVLKLVVLVPPEPSSVRIMRGQNY